MASFGKAKLIIQQALKSLLSKEYLREIGVEASNLIRTRTRLGYGVEKAGAERQKLAPLKPSTKKRRKKLQLNENTNPGKSNLTETGQLLSSIAVLEVSKTGVTVGPKGIRTDRKKNEDIAEWLAKGDPSRNRDARPFISLSKVEQKRLKEKVRKDLEKKLKKALVRAK
jgi:phage gpG-like protein